MAREGNGHIDLVVVNLYPFLAQPAIETIDIGGPTMIRAAAKNHGHVAVLTDPAAYPGVLGELQFNRGTLGDQDPPPPGARRLRPHGRVRRRHRAVVPSTARPPRTTRPRRMPRYLPLTLERAADLRYGENPHQRAARYRELGAAPGFHDATVQPGGKELSFINDSRRRVGVADCLGLRRRPGLRDRQARQPVRGGGRRRSARRVPRGPSSATRSRPSAASWR